MAKKFGWVLVAILAATAAIDTGEGLIKGSYGIGLPAEAVVGRPLTPVSVAGVGRRTVRRCAVGVYDC
jgi:hypothetical protein